MFYCRKPVAACFSGGFQVLWQDAFPSMKILPSDSTMVQLLEDNGMEFRFKIHLIFQFISVTTAHLRI
jgi:hypothetical protein